MEFEVFSGGKVTIDLSKCEECDSKACIKICSLPTMGRILELKHGKPSLRKDPKEVKRGACTECLGCELECELRGKKAVRIILPTPELDEYLNELRSSGTKTVYWI
jgi:NAD-dependent dihydropyrimidine dehydrogenase PreA subunit